MSEGIGAVGWDTGVPIPGSPFRHLIRGSDTGGRFSAQSAVLPAGQLVMPHTHSREDEFSFVFRGTVGARVGAVDHLLQAGTVLHKPRGVMHAVWNPTDEDAVVIEFISPAGFEEFFAEMGGLGAGGAPATPAQFAEAAARYGETVHPEAAADIVERFGVHL
jgi:quercetin dioxygenase-like cupin family protein